MQIADFREVHPTTFQVFYLLLSIAAAAIWLNCDVRFFKVLFLEVPWLAPGLTQHGFVVGIIVGM